jgi:hypothetical protein
MRGPESKNRRRKRHHGAPALGAGHEHAAPEHDVVALRLQLAKLVGQRVLVANSPVWRTPSTSSIAS